jgi:hypothetical protein
LEKISKSTSEGELILKYFDRSKVNLQINVKKFMRLMKFTLNSKIITLKMRGECCCGIQLMIENPIASRKFSRMELTAQMEEWAMGFILEIESISFSSMKTTILAFYCFVMWQLGACELCLLLTNYTD